MLCERVNTTARHLPPGAASTRRWPCPPDAEHCTEAVSPSVPTAMFALAYTSLSGLVAIRLLNAKTTQRLELRRGPLPPLQRAGP
jgi:hypothetical protein